MCSRLAEGLMGLRRHNARREGCWCKRQRSVLALAQQRATMCTHVRCGGKSGGGGRTKVAVPLHGHHDTRRRHRARSHHHQQPPRERLKGLRLSERHFSEALRTNRSFSHTQRRPHCDSHTHTKNKNHQAVRAIAAYARATMQPSECWSVALVLSPKSGGDTHGASAAFAQ